MIIDNDPETIKKTLEQQKDFQLIQVICPSCNANPYTYFCTRCAGTGLVDADTIEREEYVFSQRGGNAKL